MDRLRGSSGLKDAHHPFLLSGPHWGRDSLAVVPGGHGAHVLGLGPEGHGYGHAGHSSAPAHHEQAHASVGGGRGRVRVKRK